MQFYLAHYGLSVGGQLSQLVITDDVSIFSGDYMQCRLTINELLERLQLGHLFQAFVTAEDGMDTISQRFLSASIKLGRPPNQCVVFDGSPAGITAAHNCTMKVRCCAGFLAKQDNHGISCAACVAKQDNCGMSCLPYISYQMVKQLQHLKCDYACITHITADPNQYMLSTGLWLRVTATSNPLFVCHIHCFQPDEELSSTCTCISTYSP